MTKREKRELELLEQLFMRTEPLSVTEAPRWLREKNLALKAKALELTPRGVDVNVVARAVVECLELPIDFGAMQLSDEIWQAVLAKLETQSAEAGPATTFLLEATRGMSASNAGPACRSAMEAHDALHQLRTFTSKRARRLLTELSERPEIVRACQAVVVGNPLARLSMVAVLVLDGSARKTVGRWRSSFLQSARSRSCCSSHERRTRQPQRSRRRLGFSLRTRRSSSGSCRVARTVKRAD